jgi:COMPASS component SWD2
MATPFANFRLSKRFNVDTQPAQQITTLDFDDSGQYLIATSINKSIQLYDAIRGKFSKAVQSQKYGCHSAKFTHNNQHCIYASTFDDHTIRYLSLHDNSFIRYFKGHKGLVNSLEVSPTQDLVISTSMDDTVRLWDLRASNSQGLITIESPSFSAFDPSGLVCAISSMRPNKNKPTKPVFHLKDIRMFTDQAFLEVDLPEGFMFNKVEFSNDNKYILFSSLNGNHLVYDSFDGKLVNELSIGSPVPPSDWPSSGTACFTPDAKYVLSGNGAGSISLFEINADKPEALVKPLTTLASSFDLQPRMVMFNPKFQQFVSADQSVNFWIPPN